eukprot:g4940.t1
MALLASASGSYSLRGGFGQHNVSTTVAVRGAGSPDLKSGESLGADQQLTSDPTGIAVFKAQSDGNLVVYQTNAAPRVVLWASNTAGKAPSGGADVHLDLQGDGNLVFYSDPSSTQVVWASNTSSAAQLSMQEDCNLVLYDGSMNVLWASDTSCRPPPPAPTPPPPPTPPTPSPGPLPPLPDKLWFGFWGFNPTASSLNPYTFSSLIWDDPPADDAIQQYGSADGVRFLYPVQYKFFCEDGTGAHSCNLYDDYQARWDAAVPQLRALLQSQKILGFFLGDEIVCGGKGAAYSTVVTMANTIRNSFPRGSAIIFANECGGLYGDGKRVPDAIDWISLDHYRKDTKPGFIDTIRKDYYEKLVYPIMGDHQKVGIIPQAGHPRDNEEVCDDKCMAEVELQDAKDAVDWAQKDSRVALVAPYAWWRDGKVEKGLDQLKDADDLKKFWIDFGTGTRG